MALAPDARLGPYEFQPQGGPWLAVCVGVLGSDHNYIAEGEVCRCGA